MALLEKSAGKKYYTREEDEQIVSLRKEDVSVKEIAEKLGRSEASLNYRIRNVLQNPEIESFEDIKYK